jgi:signal transduction histidine kinase/CheY-like chemotaxis protein
MKSGIDVHHQHIVPTSEASVKRKISRRFYWVLAIILFGIITNLLVELYIWNLATSTTNVNNEIQADIKLINKLGNVRTHITLIQSKVRGLVITGNHEFAEDVGKITEDELRTNLTDIQHILKGDEKLKSELDTLNSKTQELVQFIYHTVSTHNEKGKAAAENLIEKKVGKELREKIFNITEEIERAIEDRVQRKAVNAGLQEQQFQWLVMIKPWVVLGLFLLLGFLILQSQRKNNALIVELNAVQGKEERIGLAKDQFIYNISHELRSPLNTVLGYTELLHKTSLDFNQSKFVTAIHFSSERLLHIVNQLLSFSKVQSGVLAVDAVAFDLHDFLHQLEGTFTQRFNKKGIELLLTIDPDVARNLRGDVHKLSQILTNLVGNALKFTEAGSVQLNVGVANPTHDRVLLVFTVFDTGVGIKSADITRIFDRYYQVSAPEHIRQEGTGLGLAITRQLVEIMGGEISVSSEVRKGSAFRVTLPFEPCSVVEKAPNEQFNGGLEMVKKLKILVVDDSEMNLDFAGHLLESWKHKVVKTLSSRDALEKLKADKFDLVLTDIQMPQMDGHQLAKEIRGTLNLSVPIIATTAHIAQDEEALCRSEGMNGFLSKPFKEIDLYNVIMATMRMDKSNVVNLSYLKNISKGDLEFERRIQNNFLANVPAQLTLLEQSLTQNERPGVLKALHNLKVSISVFGLSEAIKEPIQTLAAFGKGEVDGSPKDAIEKLKVVFEDAMNEIREY